MRPFPDTLAKLLEQPFLTEPDWDRFTELVHKRMDAIEVGESVLCAEVDPVNAIAVIFSTLLKGGGVFLANPDWRQNEWEQVMFLTGFHKVFGEVPAVADPASGQRFREARVMIPSGGTSGVIRFCVHSLDTLASAVYALYRHQRRKPLNSFNSLPMFHVSGLMPVWRALLTGGLVKLIDWKFLDADPSPKHPGKPCSISLVPTQLFHLAQSSAGLSFLHSLDVIYLGGGKTPPQLVQLIRYEKLPVEFVYGMTETAAMVVYGTRGDTDELGAVWGQALPGVEIMLNEDGEISVRSQSLFRGYYPEDCLLRE
ncbi:MAG: AMP-binding protein, partial [Cyanothece sp. SIO1E1]|nr:AMP-binding protein [Cyanothece sp. SIO1E1]